MTMECDVTAFGGLCQIADMRHQDNVQTGPVDDLVDKSRACLRPEFRGRCTWIVREGRYRVSGRYQLSRAERVRRILGSKETASSTV